MNISFLDDPLSKNIKRELAIIKSFSKEMCSKLVLFLCLPSIHYRIDPTCHPLYKVPLDVREVIVKKIVYNFLLRKEIQEGKLITAIENNDDKMYTYIESLKTSELNAPLNFFFTPSYNNNSFVTFDMLYAPHTSLAPNLEIARKFFIIIAAICKGDIKLIKYLIQKGIDLNPLNSNGISPLKIVFYFKLIYGDNDCPTGFKPYPDVSNPEWKICHTCLRSQAKHETIFEPKPPDQGNYMIYNTMFHLLRNAGAKMNK